MWKMLQENDLLCSSNEERVCANMNTQERKREREREEG